MFIFRLLHGKVKCEADLYGALFSFLRDRGRGYVLILSIIVDDITPFFEIRNLVYTLFFLYVRMWIFGFSLKDSFIISV